MTGIVAPLASDDDIDLAGQDIDNFSFALISPLGAYKNSV